MRQHSQICLAELSPNSFRWQFMSIKMLGSDDGCGRVYEKTNPPAACSDETTVRKFSLCEFSSGCLLPCKWASTNPTMLSIIGRAVLVVQLEESLKVMKRRLQGDAGPKGGPPGDLYVFLKVKASPDFKRDGADIYSQVGSLPYQSWCSF